MKRIWFGVVLLAALLLLGSGSSKLMEQAHLAQAKNLDSAAKLALEDNWNGAESFMGAAQREWDKKRPLFAGLCDHEPMDQIEGFYAQLEVFARARDAVSFSSSCRYLARQLEALGKSHSFNLQNFF